VAILDDAMTTIRKFAPNAFPKVAIILGSGLSTFADQIENPITIPFQAFGLSSGTVTGHASLLMFGTLNGIPIVCLKGRLHLYEGATYEAIRTYIRIFKHLGVRSLITTCAAGSLRDDVAPRELAVFTDHINFQPGNPLAGPNDESMGPRFVSMEEAYDNELRTIYIDTASKLGFEMHQGVYISVLGPSFETPAEIRMFRTMGADFIGMSVVPEVIIARHTGIRVLATGVITNYAAGMTEEKITHEGTLRQGELAARKLVKIIPAFLRSAETELSA
jgi:xanthosine phosphorylase